MLPHVLVKRQRSQSVESVGSSTSNKRSTSNSSQSPAAGGGGASTTGSQILASSRMAAMDLNTSSNDGSSSSSTEPLMSENGDAGPASASASSNTAIPPRHSPPADGQVQLDLVLEHKKDPFVEGDTWFVVDRRWFRRWQAACGSNGGDDSDSKQMQDVSMDEVGPIDNSQISNTTTGRLLRPVQEGQDVEFLPGLSWHMLEAWYGTTGLPIQRSVIKAKDGLVLDLYPPLVTISKVVPANSTSFLEPAKQLQTSSGWTVKELKTKMAEALDLDLSASSRLWLLEEENNTQTATLLSLTPEKLEHASLEPAADDEIIRYSSITADAALAIEQANEDGSWLVNNAATQGTSSSLPGASTTRPIFGGPAYTDIISKIQPKRAAVSNTPPSSQTSEAVASSSTLAAPSMRFTRSQTGSSGTKKGLVGLTNLGNTCFMNSALQCLSNTPALHEYFQSGYWESELNPTNILGMKGEVAKAYGHLMDRIWNGSQSVTTPREFKHTLSKFAPAFSGWQQHDSQELIAFLLDGLHEDLNRIKQKPYDEVPDWNGGTEKDQLELAKNSWEIYKRRNDSVIVDLFQGQLRNRLTCPECGKIAIKFDPFMYLSLAIPQYRKWTGDVFLVPADPQRPQIRVTLELPANASFKKLKQAVGELTGYDAKKLFCIEEYSHKFWKVWPDSEQVSSLQTNDVITLHELPYEIEQPMYRPSKGPTPEDEGKIFVTVLSAKAGGNSSNYAPSKFFGEPFILAFSAEEARSLEVIERKLCERLESWQGVGEKIWSAPSYDSAVKATTPLKPSRAVIADDEEEEDPSISKDTEMDGATVNPPLDSREARMPNTEAVRFFVSRRPFGTYDNKPFTDTTSSDRLTLRERLAAVAGGGKDEKPVPHTPLPGSFSVDEPDDLYGDADETTNGQEQKALPESMEATIPILRTGETILIEWDPTFAAEAFGTEAEKTRTDPTESFSKQERIIDPVVVEKRKASKSANNKPAITVENLLDEFVKEEKLSEDNMWYCSNCKKHQEAPKKFDLWKMPDVLVIHLKRFSNERAFRDKIDTFIDFPVTGLDLTDRVEGKKVAAKLAAQGDAAELIEETGTNESLVYDLFAVDNHFGGLGGGHYTAFAKNIVDGRWYNFDDSRVSPVSDPEDVKTSAAYLLFYVRRTSKPIGGKTHEILASKTVTPALSAAGSRPVSPPGERPDSAMRASDDQGDDTEISFEDGSPVASPTVSDDGVGSNKVKLNILNWQNENIRFAPPPGPPPPRYRPNDEIDSSMTYSPASPIRSSPSSPAPVEIRLGEEEIAQAASGIDMGTSSHMDEIE